MSDPTVASDPLLAFLQKNTGGPKKKKRKKWNFKDERFIPDLASKNVVMEGKIGSGMFGAVYRGTYNTQEVAIKQVRTKKESRLSEKEYESFIQEGRLMLSLDAHVNLIAIHLIVYNRESPAIVMNLASRGTLRDYLVSIDTLELELCYALIAGVASGLHHLHRNRIIHRDVAARNILLTDKFVPMLSDFGLSREVFDGDERYNSTGQVGLPLKWMAPEALKNGSFTTMTDMWSFGVTVWEMAVCGGDPFPDQNSVEVIILIRDHFETPDLPIGIDETLKVVIDQCWFRDPDMRPSARDVLAILKERDI